MKFRSPRIFCPAWLLRFFYLLVILLLGSNPKVIFANEFYDANGSGVSVKVWKTKDKKFDLALLLDLKGAAISNAWAIKGVRVIEAIDNSGNNLATNQVVSKIPYYRSLLHTQILPHDELRTSLTFRHLPQDTKTFKKIVADVDLISPCETNHGVVLISNVLRSAGSTIQNSVLTEFAIKVACFDQRAFEVKTNEILTAKAKGKHFKQGTMDEVFARALDTSFVGFCFDSKSTIRLIIQDPHNKLCDLDFTNPSHPNNFIGAGNYNATFDPAHEWWIYCFEQAPTENWQLRLYLDAPRATTTKRIVLEDIVVR